jgi:uncharacterized protein with HEPN domain
MSLKSFEHAADTRRSPCTHSGSHQQYPNILSGMTAAGFAADNFRRLAIERFFEMISEASRNIPGSVNAQLPEIDWLGMADLGN